MKTYLILAALGLSALTSSAIAKNTVDDWKWLSKYYQTYGEWTTACEERADNPTVMRCYLRYVDAYAREPFGAMFVFVTSTADGPRFAFEFETGTKFDKNWSIPSPQENGKPIWSFNPEACPASGECIIIGQQATGLAKALGAPGAKLTFSITDKVQRSFDLVWPGDKQFADAFNDLQKQTADRQ